MNPLGIPTPDQWPIISEELAGRRGHFLRQRVGPRDEHLHELRWIPPVIVNAGGMPDVRPTVVVLPKPEGVLRNRLLAARAKGKVQRPKGET